MPSSIFDRWDLVVVPFPFTDLPVAKARPALLLTDATFQRAHDHSILAMVTTGAGSSWPSDVPIQDLEAAGLVKPCVIRLKLFTLSQELIRRRIGKLTASDRRAACKALAGAFDLS
jgi:mRNA interferase MazF